MQSFVGVEKITKAVDRMQETTTVESGCRLV